MELTIRPMTPEDADAKGYVHYTCWQETYAGLVDSGYLSRMSVEKCQDMARRRPDNILVAELDGRIVGFTGFGTCRNPGCESWGEVFSIYLLKEAQGMGIGRKLMDSAMEQLKDFDTVVIWVLKGNDHAFGFYRHYGFEFDGTEAPILIGTPNTELRLIYHRNKE